MIALLLLAIVASCYADKCPYAVEQCPKITPKDPVDIARLKGTWVVQYHSANFPFRCATLTFKPKGGVPPKKMKFIVKGIRNKDDAYFEETIMIPLGKSCTNPKGAYVEPSPGINSLGESVFPGPVDFFVLDTDYDTYDLMYGCDIIGGQKTEFLCFHTREGVDPPSVDKVKQILKKQGVLKDVSDKREDLISPARQNCPT